MAVDAFYGAFSDGATEGGWLTRQSERNERTDAITEFKATWCFEWWLMRCLIYNQAEATKGRLRLLVCWWFGGRSCCWRGRVGWYRRDVLYCLL